MMVLYKGYFKTPSITHSMRKLMAEKVQKEVRDRSALPVWIFKQLPM